MTELNGTVLAQPERLTDFTFTAVQPDSTSTKVGPAPPSPP
jgi:hypothetical protein